LLSLLFALLAPGEAHARVRWHWPVRGAVAARFFLAPDRFVAGQRRGIDIAAAPGATVRSACRGRVTFAGAVPAGGRTVAVRCGALSATYLHLGRYGVRRGQELSAAQRLGSVGPRRFGYLDPLSLLGEEPNASPPAVGPRGPGGRFGGPPLRFPSPAPWPVAARPAVGRSPVAGLPLGALWVPAGFALLIGLAALTAAGRLRAGGARLGKTMRDGRARLGAGRGVRLALAPRDDGRGRR
jgi:hypothetical protein